MRSTRTTPLLIPAFTLAAAILLTGCFSPPPSGPLKSRHTEAATPLFATEEEALAAAEEAYAKYVAMTDLVGSEGGAHPERIDALVTADWFEDELDSFASFAESGLRQIGQTAISNSQLQQYSEINGSRASLSMYVCVDFTEVRFVDASGSEVALADRPDMVTLIVELEAGRNQVFLVSGLDRWNGASVC